jgi:hypothetical protein
MLSAGAHTQAIYTECNMSRVQTVPVFPRSSFGLLSRDHKVKQHVVSASKQTQAIVTRSSEKKIQSQLTLKSSRQDTKGEAPTLAP